MDTLFKSPTIPALRLVLACSSSLPCAFLQALHVLSAIISINFFGCCSERSTRIMITGRLGVRIWRNSRLEVGHYLSTFSKVPPREVSTATASGLALWEATVAIVDLGSFVVPIASRLDQQLVDDLANEQFESVGGRSLVKYHSTWVILLRMAVYGAQLVATSTYCHTPTQFLDEFCLFQTIKSNFVSYSSNGVAEMFGLEETGPKYFDGLENIRVLCFLTGWTVSRIFATRQFQISESHAPRRGSNIWITRYHYWTISYTNCYNYSGPNIFSTDIPGLVEGTQGSYRGNGSPRPPGIGRLQDIVRVCCEVFMSESAPLEVG
ncbi:hypothetical protein V8D89_007380 [Ganoderma adspersum]